MKSIATFAIAAAIMASSLISRPSMAESQPFIGQIQFFAGNYAPQGWGLCDGQLLPINQYQALFSILGTTYGGDGRTTFALPDMRGRIPIHEGNGPSLTARRLGDKAGSENNNLTLNHLPNHNHALTANSNSARQSDPTNRSLARTRSNLRSYDSASDSVPPDTTMNSAALVGSGGSVPVDNMQPVIGVNCIIALQGIFPSLN